MLTFVQRLNQGQRIVLAIALGLAFWLLATYIHVTDIRIGGVPTVDPRQGPECRASPIAVAVSCGGLGSRIVVHPRFRTTKRQRLMGQR